MGTTKSYQLLKNSLISFVRKIWISSFLIIRSTRVSSHALPDLVNIIVHHRVPIVSSMTRKILTITRRIMISTSNHTFKLMLSGLTTWVKWTVPVKIFRSPNWLTNLRISWRKSSLINRISEVINFTRTMTERLLIKAPLIRVFVRISR